MNKTNSKRLINTENKLAVTRGEGVGGWVNGKKFSKNVWYLDIGDGYMGVYTCKNSSSCTLKFVNFNCMYPNKQIFKIIKI